jgi:hypothetical protein
MSLVELGLLHYGHLDVTGGAVTVNFFWVPLGAVQGLAESLVVLDELTALGQDEGLVFTTLRIPQLFKLILIPLGSGPRHFKGLGLSEVIRHCLRLDGAHQLINQLAGILV